MGEIEFKRYHKIRPLGALENEGILDEGIVYIFEKLDGSNVQIRTKANDDGGVDLVLGSRTRYIDKENGQFAKFWDWAHTHHPSLYDLEPNVILFGEWLAKHVVQYNKEAHDQFYLFDVYDIDRMAFLPYDDVEGYAKRFNLNLVKPWFVGTPEELDDYMQFVGRSDYGDRGEGVIIKRYDFRNRFGHQSWAKIVSDEFKEDFRKKTFQEQAQAKSNEHDVLAMFVTPARVKKFIEKARNGELDLEGDLYYTGDMRDMRWLPKFIYNDIIDEEAHYICRNFARVDFDAMRRRCGGFVAGILKGMVNG